MVFQVVVPRQLRDLEVGMHRLQFVYQEPKAFEACNDAHFLDTIKTPAGVAFVAGVELTLLDCVRYMHRAGGVSSAAQLVKELGSRADARKLAKAASHYEGAVARRLGYLLEQGGHTKPARALHVYADSAKHFAPLGPGVKPVVAALSEPSSRELTWKLELNEVVEVDA
jgi:predicted transcriptional regulator of viral defense system